MNQGRNSSSSGQEKVERMGMSFPGKVPAHRRFFAATL